MLYYIYTKLYMINIQLFNKYSSENYEYIYNSYINAVCSTKELIYDCSFVKELLMSCGHKLNLHSLDISQYNFHGIIRS